MPKIELANWTNYPKQEVAFSEFAFRDDILSYVKENDSLIARGNGRCYGDASLSDENVLSTLKTDQILDFNESSGVIHLGAGILFSDILNYIVPKGWFLPVTPGTKFITVGGAIASNVHGKNHHKEGGISNYILEFDLIGSEGTVETVTQESNKELFDLTCGGMGLTGVILSAKMQLKKIETSYIKFKSIKANNLEDAFQIFEKHKHYTYSMAWIDCLQKGNKQGRSIVMVGEHATNAEVDKNEKLTTVNKTLFKLPFNFPGWILNKLSVKAFNFLYYGKQLSKEVNKFVHYDGFFYPLDAILEWNKMYGKKGFLQYQCVLPLNSSYEGLLEILSIIEGKGAGSFLAVLKLMGKEDNEISFPIEGYTLALDFPIKKGLFEMLDELDEIVLKYKGRLYLSKDARMSQSMYENSYENSTSIRKKLQSIDPKNIFQSGLNQRLNIK